MVSTRRRRVREMHYLPKKCMPEQKSNDYDIYYTCLNHLFCMIQPFNEVLKSGKTIHLCVICYVCL